MRRTQPELFDDRLTVAERERQRLKRILYQEQRKRAARRKPGRALQVPGGQR